MKRKPGRPKKEEKITENSGEETTQAEIPVKDPSFNCVPCKGEGMIFDNANPGGKICERCRGNGKI